MRYVSLVALFLAAAFCAAQSPQPEDISGLYSFVGSGGELQINEQADHKIIGYVTVAAHEDSDEVASPSSDSITLMFETASLKANHFEFKTKKVQGRLFEFKGHVERGQARSRDEEGYLVLRGTLTTVSDDAQGKSSSKSSEVEFKSFPADLSR